ncbi:hypothetical protein OG21DRAFT_1057041 [Imleria badia]|nr:hypothetical protein OG21DRAFT_1057041 [Imleria badia]
MLQHCTAKEIIPGTKFNSGNAHTSVLAKRPLLPCGVCLTLAPAVTRRVNFNHNCGARAHTMKGDFHCCTFHVVLPVFLLSQSAKGASLSRFPFSAPFLRSCVIGRLNFINGLPNRITNNYGVSCLCDATYTGVATDVAFRTEEKQDWSRPRLEYKMLNVGQPKSALPSAKRQMTDNYRAATCWHEKPFRTDSSKVDVKQ